MRENSEDLSLFSFFNLSKIPSSVLSKNVVETLKPEKRRKSRNSFKKEISELEQNLATHNKPTYENNKSEDSAMKSSKSFYDQFDSIPLHLLAKENAESESSARIDEIADEIDSDGYIERVLTEEEKDAMKLALQMDEEAKASKGVI